MLEALDLSKKIPKQEYKSVIAEMQTRLGELQRKARELRIPIIVVFEGWDAAGKGTLINKLMLAMDPRGFTVNPTNPPNEEERLRPFLWRFWINTPELGRIAIFDRSWYGRVLVERIDKIIPKKIRMRAFEEIKAFERQLTDSGCVIIKYFLHISMKEQRRRFKKLEANPSTSWKVAKEDWKHNRQYEKYLRVTEEMLAKTETSNAPWTLVEAHDERFATLKLFKTCIDAVEGKISQIQRTGSTNREKRKTKAGIQAARKATAVEPASSNPGSDPGGFTPAGLAEELSTSLLEKVDLTPALDREEYQRSLDRYQKRLREIEHEVYLKRVPVIILYEGWDAAGKGGNIRRLVQGMDPRGYEVIPIAAPNDIEKAHHYLWRFWMQIPKAGHIAIFDRSWYGRVMVERVEGFCSEEEWKLAYREINETEEQWAGFGAVLIKFWLQIDKEEQMRRFKDRQQNPYKQWKITDEDWRNREKWELYKRAVDEMLLRTSTPYAPWTIVESNCKWHARIKALKTVIQEIEKHL
ncbi:MAG TPA: phosphate--AMP phosphotransferase [Spirochaetia bacterium]|nr:phosphate--AMP phosphotransferase [Spirochaetia bacterium]